MILNIKPILIVAAAFLGAAPLSAYEISPRKVETWENGWKFHKGEAEGASEASYDDSRWENVTVPHDWAITGPFDRNHDIQKVAVVQDGEETATWKTGRTGGLPYMGVGWYRRNFDVPAGKRAVLVFDGAMSEARVYVNGEEVCFWPNGYNSFHCDVTDFINEAGKEDVLAVRLENLPFSSRWYPGAGLYRNVYLVLTEDTHVPVWGTRVTTPHVASDFASVRLEVSVDNAGDGNLTLVTDILDGDGKKVAGQTYTGRNGQPFVQNFIVENPRLWSPETPALYRAVTRIYAGDRLVDEYTTRFGIRSIEFIADKGFYLNGKPRKFQGVCNHHDLGPLGAAVNEAALKHQLRLLKDMGCDAIRTSHNMPAPELVRLCEEMGFMMMIEPFDEWDIAKCKNGYHRFFNEDSGDGVTWAEKDMVNMIRQYRNSPCVVMWSIGNEVPTQCVDDGYRVAKFLQDICHREDPTRPVTCGMDRVDCILENGFAAMVDIPGLNYRTFRYIESYDRLPQKIILGSETGSTVSSRGVYKLPAVKRFGAADADHQCSAYELDACGWSNIPDVDFALADDWHWTMGQFVWTGFDYLGEPSPYSTDAWPNHSSMFGIIDLASLPKDRYWLFRSVWNRESPTLHVLPHWNWAGHEGEEIPVFVFTSYPEAELFINGVSYGRRRKTPAPRTSDGFVADSSKLTKGGQTEALESRYRLMWNDAVYQPGEIRVVAYGEDGSPAAEKVIRTAGRPHHLELVTDYPEIRADGKDLAYVTVKVVDKDGNLCPTDGRLIEFSVSGAARYRAAANGDPTCLDIFHEPRMHAFNGMLTVILQSSAASVDTKAATGAAIAHPATATPGSSATHSYASTATLTARAKGLKPATLTISVK